MGFDSRDKLTRVFTVQFEAGRANGPDLDVEGLEGRIIWEKRGICGMVDLPVLRNPPFGENKK
jgi:hypothetical protein